MRVLAVAAMVGGLLSGVVYYYQNFAGRPARAAEVSTTDPRVERGRYLVSILDCNACHTPFKMTDKGPMPDMDRMLSGHPETLAMSPPPKLQGVWAWSGAMTNTAFAGPWGVTYAANLTPDKNTGLGIWDEAMFIQALRTGKHFGSARPIQPPMPWPAYRNMTDQDLKAVFAYLRSIPPIKNHVPDYEAPE
jgi:hypothetical protein